MVKLRTLVLAVLAAATVLLALAAGGVARSGPSALSRRAAAATGDARPRSVSTSTAAGRTEAAAALGALPHGGAQGRLCVRWEPPPARIS